MAQAGSLLSDQNLELLLQETRWGSGGVTARITGSPDPAKFRAFWTGLTLYRLAAKDFQRRFDQALSDAAGRNAWTIHAQSVIQAKHDMMQAPGDYPFCLGPRQWREHCQALWGGLIDGNDYRPPNAYTDMLLMVGKTLFASAAGVGIALLLPEEAMAGTALAAISGPGATKAIGLAAANTVVEHALPTSNPLDDMAKATVWRRYQLENRRRKLT